MERIELNKVVPRVFSGMPVGESEVWSGVCVFERGRSYLLAAESGAGKSSLCGFMYGSRSDYDGTISFDGKDVRRYDISQWSVVRKRHIAYLPQDMRLFSEMTVLENIEMKNRLTGYKSRNEVMQLLERLGIGDKRGSLVGTLSLGQQQRVAIVRSLCQPCEFIILDEPVSHLDDQNNAIVGELIAEEANRCGAAVIVTSVGNNLRIKYNHKLKL